MDLIANNYAIALHELLVKKKEVQEAKEIFIRTPELFDCLKNPIVSTKSKHRVINRIFKGTMKNMLNVLCDCHDVSCVFDIFQAYDEILDKENAITKAHLYYVTPPDSKQKKQFERFILKKYGGKKVELSFIEQPELIGGFRLQVGNYEIDYSLKGRLTELKKKLSSR